MTQPKSIVYLDDITADSKTVKYHYHVEGPAKEAFLVNAEFRISYSESIASVPNSVLSIPFVTNVLPLVWLYDAELVLPEIDKDFYGHLDEIRNGYRSMYPKLSFNGSLTPGKMVKNGQKRKKGGDLLLFSGGVDATSSLITIMNSKKRPLLVTLWGADVSLDDREGWKEKSNHTKNIASKFSLKHSLVRTEFRSLLDTSTLNKLVSRGTDDEWWHGFQHGIGIIGHAAPLVYIHNISTVYIAASFTRGDHVSCASDPSIDEHVHVAGCTTVHDGYDFNRQDKIRNIHAFVQNEKIDNLPVKVCWKSLGAKNCGQCEKCIRSACGFLVEGGDLDVYDLGSFDMQYAKRYLTKIHYFRHTLQWQEIQNRLQETYDDLSQTSKDSLAWLLTIDLAKINNTFYKKLRHRIEVAKVGIVRRLPKRIRNGLKYIMGRL